MTKHILAAEHDPFSASSPEALPLAFAAAFNTGDPELIERLYHPQGLFISAPGRLTVGASRSAANAEMVALGVPIDVKLRQVYSVDDIALLIVDWQISGLNASGDSVDVRGTATDVASRGEDGFWRYLIDNPFGGAGKPS